MRQKLTHALAAALAMFIVAPAFADGPGDAGPDVAAPPVRAQPQAPSSAPEGRTGQIGLDDLSINVAEGYVFYPASEAYAFMQRNNASSPPGAVLGLIARQDANVRAPGAWATVVSYDAIGYVQGETASGLEESGFEASVRQARSAQNRAFEGFAFSPTFQAEDPPSLTWAERAARPGSAGADMRFEQRMLGRYGVAGLTSIGSADQLTQIQAAADRLKGMLSFPQGRRHAEFEPASDQVSAYSVPGLVTGVPAQAQAAGTPLEAGQTGFGGLAGWFPWVAVGAIGLGLAGYLMMRRRRDDEQEDEA